MNWIKRNLIWLVGLLLFVLIVLGSLLLLKNQILEKDRVAAELAFQRDELQKLVNRANYPENFNVEQMRQDNDKLEDKIDGIVGKLAEARIKSESLTGIKFRQLVNDRTQVLARLAKQDGVSIPADYLFGFSRYEKTIPEDQDVPLLMKQLNVIEEIMKILFNSHVLLLDSVKRVEFEDASAQEITAGKRRKADEYTQMPNGFQGIQNDPSKIYVRMPFEIQFACDAESLRNFLNSITNSKYVLIPVYVRVKAEEAEVKGKVIKPEITPEGKVITRLAEEAELAEKTTKYVLGLQKINVQMKIDWYEFRAPPEKAKTKRGKNEESGSKNESSNKEKKKSEVEKQ